MSYSATALNVLMRLGGMLEHDGIGSAEEFSEVFRILVEDAGVPLPTIATAMGQSGDRIRSWRQGSGLPDPKKWHWFANAIRTMILEITQQA
jgi:hypothetical protein